MTVGDIEDLWLPIVQLEPGEEATITQSYHLSEDAGNAYQGDSITFNMILYAEQYMGAGPEHTTRGVVLENKAGDPHWIPVIDGTWGLLTWDGSGNYTLRAWGLDNSLTYRVAYYDGSSESGVSDYFSPDASGELTITGTYAAFNANGDAKYWLRPDDWDNAKTLWEANLVK